MSNREEEEFYRQKYLKYKAKYLEAKNQIEGGATFSLDFCAKSSKYIYFFDSSLFSEGNNKELDFLKDERQANYKALSSERKGCDFDKKLFTFTGGKRGMCGYIELRSKNFIKSMSKGIKNWLTGSKTGNTVENNAHINIILGKSDYEKLNPSLQTNILDDKNNIIKEKLITLLTDINKVITDENNFKEDPKHVFVNGWNYIIMDFPLGFANGGFIDKLETYSST